MQLYQLINFWKLSTGIWIMWLMFFYQNYSSTAYLYLSLHGTYGILWTLKSLVCPDKSFMYKIDVWEGFYSSLFLMLYWVFPFVIVKYNTILLNWELCIVMTIFTIGVFLHFGSDIQKYYTLLQKKKFIDEGFFKWIRNPNYLGELFIYSSFVYCTQSRLCYIILLFNVCCIWIPRMYIKEWYLRKYPEYKITKTKLWIPFVW
jgi:protein-S-isoprenylcysteine O-methyltransferase Ste14